MTNFERLLKEKCLKITPARLAVLEIFSSNNKPFSVDDIQIKLSKNRNIKKINEATIYRIISAFEKLGILRRVDLRRDSICFELSDDHHHHLVCNSCGLIEDFKENKGIEKILEQIVKKSSEFKNIKEHSLELFGVCKNCSVSS